MDFGAMLNRLVRAARLDVSLYEEVEADTGLTQEAITAVVIVAALSGVGAGLKALIGGAGVGSFFVALIVGILISLVGYFIWAFLTYFIGVNLFKGTADYGELLRTLGYANGPNALGLLSFIPVVGGLLSFVGSIWALVCGVIAVRQALDFDTTKAVLTVIIGWIVVLVISLLIGGALGFGAFGLASLSGGLR
jgi:hypothetical protein